MLDETEVQDLVDQIAWYQDELPETNQKISDATINLTKFEFKPTTTDKRIYFQFEEENQYDYLVERFILDKQTAHVYPLVEKLTKAFYSVRADNPTLVESAFGKAGVDTLKSLPQPQTTQVFTGQPAPARVSLKDRIGELFKPDIKSLNDLSIQDPWIRSIDMVEEAKNIPNLYVKFAEFHENNVIRTRVYPDLFGQKRWLGQERWYFNTKVTTQLSKMIEASQTILLKNDTDRIAMVLTQYLSDKERHRGDFIQQPG